MGIFSRSGSRGSANKRDWLRRWVMPTGQEDPKLDEIKRAAAADVAEIEKENEYFDPRGPGNQEDDL